MSLARDLAPQVAQRTARRFHRPDAPAGTVARRTGRNLPAVVVANLLVVLLPAVAAWALMPGGGLAPMLGAMGIAVVVSAAVASLGSALWTRRMACSELVFSDLLLWGWARRIRAERRLAAACDLLASDAGCVGPESPSGDRQLLTLRRLSTLLDAQDPYTRGHSRRVTRHAERIAKTMHVPRCDVAKLRTAAALHDIGKIHTPQAVLHKPGRLTDEEFGVVKRHPGEGAAMLAGLDDQDVVAMVRHHHERLDGSGYPDGLAGAEIPLGARIIAVADTFDAMTSNRSYRGAFEHRKALEVLAGEAGTRLDAAAVSAFQAYYAGRRLAACSALLTATAPRLFGWLGSGPQVAAAAAPSLGKALPAIGAAALLAGPVGGSAGLGPGSDAGSRKAGAATQVAAPAPAETGASDRQLVNRPARGPVAREPERADRLRKVTAPDLGRRRGDWAVRSGATRTVSTNPPASALAPARPEEAVAPNALPPDLIPAPVSHEPQPRGRGEGRGKADPPVGAPPVVKSPAIKPSLIDPPVIDLPERERAPVDPIGTARRVAKPPLRSTGNAVDALVAPPATALDEALRSTAKDTSDGAVETRTSVVDRVR